MSISSSQNEGIVAIGIDRSQSSKRWHWPALGSKLFLKCRVRSELSSDSPVVVVPVVPVVSSPVRM